MQNLLVMTYLNLINNKNFPQIELAQLTFRQYMKIKVFVIRKI